MKKTATYILVCLLLLAGDLFADSLDQVKRRLEEADCIRLEFLSIVESDVFETVDSALGTASIADDGRYLLRLSADVYLYDLTDLYSYSAANNQLVVEMTNGGTPAGDEVSFIKNLDRYYSSRTIEPDLAYHLTRKPEFEGDYPDSMNLYLNPDGTQLERIEYLDVNEELNRILFLKIETESDCDDNVFEPNFPDSVDRVRL